ncbi:MAG: response regulator [Alteraurantiacibacter sp.]
MTDANTNFERHELLRILIVEDEWLVALDLESILEDAGYSVCGPANTVETALELIESERVDLGLLDINLGKKTSYPIAAALREKAKPFAFLSGHSDAHIDSEFRDAPLISKPVEPKRLINHIGKLTHRA